MVENINRNCNEWKLKNEHDKYIILVADVSLLLFQLSISSDIYRYYLVG